MFLCKNNKVRKDKMDNAESFLSFFFFNLQSNRILLL